MLVQCVVICYEQNQQSRCKDQRGTLLYMYIYVRSLMCQFGTHSLRLEVSVIPARAHGS